MIKIDKKENCCGCTACVAICPKSCIEMKEDLEGFLYPQVDEKKCVECGACERVCPIKNVVKENMVSQKAYLVQNKNEEIRLDSSAGGAFSAIASTILNRGGVVFGAAYDENFQVKHTYVENVDDIRKFRNSKYVQSDLGNTFEIVKGFLKKGRWVCYSGTPCQIEGLASFLGKTYKNLILVDVVCHGVPSPLVWNRYLEFQQVKECKPDNIRFRDKFYGYKYSTMSIIRDGKNIYHAGAQLDPMLRAFFSDICDRPTCYKCPFKKRYRVSDITIWDCFSVYDFNKKIDDDKGTTRVLCHTKKGQEIIESSAGYIQCFEVEPDRLVSGVKEMFQSVSYNPKRNQFMSDAKEMLAGDLFQKYYPITYKIKIKTWIRKILIQIKLYGTMKMILNKLKGR